jgi:hypothetical protein
LAGARETFVTTTGGPEHFLEDPAISETSNDPVVLDRAEPLDGDDITVEPNAPGAGSRRARLAIAAGIAAVLLVGGIAVAMANRHHASTNGASHLRSVAPASPAAAHPTPAVHVKPAVKPNTKPAQPAPSKPVTPINHATPVVAAPPATIAAPAATTPVAATPPPVVAPPVEPTSVLRWTATPASLSITRGARASLTVTVANPTKGTVTLGTPLSCAPTLRGPGGVAIGGSVCEQLAQVMQPHSELIERYTIFATDTGDASGQALAPGSYTAIIENLFKVKVNVTKS